ncbi:hypothetical protein AOLI_G00269910 [Acnodon oligacanthus]
MVLQLGGEEGRRKEKILMNIASSSPRQDTSALNPLNARPNPSKQRTVQGTGASGLVCTTGRHKQEVGCCGTSHNIMRGISNGERRLGIPPRAKAARLNEKQPSGGESLRGR